MAGLLAVLAVGVAAIAGLVIGLDSPARSARGRDRRRPISVRRSSHVDRLTRSSDIDAIVMHGPHVVHPVEVVNATPVIWSVGIVAALGDRHMQ